MSPRRFFRVALASGGSVVVMYVPTPKQGVQTAARQVVGTASFVEVARWLERRGVRVPRVIFQAPEFDTLIVEDLGDDTLAEYLRRTPEAAPALYRKAVSDLARAQLEFESANEPCSIHERAFDDALLRWEFDHFKAWALDARGIALSPGEQFAFSSARDELARTIAGWPRGFVHRDYQSRNLMVQEKDGSPELWWIDFQDAMLGPRTYDLVALLMDSYRDFDESFVSERLAEYASVRGLEADLPQVAQEFDLITVQRKLKDAGRFVFFAQTSGDLSFLKYVDPSIHRARTALRRVARRSPALAALQEVLDARLGTLSEGRPPAGS